MWTHTTQTHIHTHHVGRLPWPACESGMCRRKQFSFTRVKILAMKALKLTFKHLPRRELIGLEFWW